MENSKKMTWYTLAFMAFSTVWGFGNVLNGFVYFNGIQVIFSWVMMFALYFVPYALMVGELGSAFKNSGFVLTRIGYSNIWPLFGSANQLLSALVLVTLCVFMKVTGRSNKMLFPPLAIMLCVTTTALVQRTKALVTAFASGSATFMVEGLQLVIAVLLMLLGLIIVVNSLRAYFASRHNSEKTAPAAAS